MILSSVDYAVSEDRLFAPSKIEHGITMGDNLRNSS
jgi:hypothetical protein